MASIRLPNYGGEVMRQQSVGRQRIDAPIEAFGGGANARALQQVGQGLASVGQGLQRIDAERERQARIEAAKQKELASALVATREREDKDTLQLAMARGASILNKAKLYASQTQNPEEVGKIYEQAHTDMAAIASDLPSTVRKRYDVWSESERYKADTDRLRAEVTATNRQTAIKRKQTQLSLVELSTSQDDREEAYSNAINWAKTFTEMTPEQQENVAKETMRMMDRAYVGKMNATIADQIATQGADPEDYKEWEATIGQMDGLTDEDKKSLQAEARSMVRAAKYEQAQRIKAQQEQDKVSLAKEMVGMAPVDLNKTLNRIQASGNTELYKFAKSWASDLETKTNRGEEYIMLQKWFGATREQRLKLLEENTKNLSWEDRQKYAKQLDQAYTSEKKLVLNEVMAEIKELATGKNSGFDVGDTEGVKSALRELPVWYNPLRKIGIKRTPLTDRQVEEINNLLLQWASDPSKTADDIKTAVDKFMQPIKAEQSIQSVERHMKETFSPKKADQFRKDVEASAWEVKYLQERKEHQTRLSGYSDERFKKVLDNTLKGK